MCVRQYTMYILYVVYACVGTERNEIWIIIEVEV